MENGDYYIGEWKNNMKNRKGKYIINKRIWKGEIYHNEVFFEGGYLGADYILMYSPVYESSIYINNIYSPEPRVRKVEGKWENK
jgi:hypothetical protein